MRVSIIGAGAIGSVLGHAFARAGHQVALLDRAPRLEAIAARGGLVVEDPGGRESVAAPAQLAAWAEAVGPQDVVFLATKSHDLPAVATTLPPLLGADTCVVTLQNGIPWWYFQRLQHPLAGRRLRSVDPDGMLERHIDASRLVGCVAYPAAILRADGSVKHVEGDRFPVGELDGRELERTRQLQALFASAGFRSRVLPDIRSEIWLKALGALSINPISALTRATMAEICSFGPTRSLVADMMREARGIAGSLGVSFRYTIDERIEGARAVGQHKTSMLQDVENGRPLELDALMEVILELAELTNCRADAIRSIHACAALLDRGIRATAG